MCDIAFYSYTNMATRNPHYLSRFALRWVSSLVKLYRNTPAARRILAASVPGPRSPG
jgi:hypothetical protein